MRVAPNGKIGQILYGIASLWVGAVILVLVLVALACATLYESMHGTEQTLAAFYMSQWFHGLLAMLGINVFVALAIRLPFSRDKIGFVLTHTSILLILIGALVTRLFGVDGQISLLEGGTTGELRSTNGERLTLTNQSNGASAFVDLGRSIFGGLVAADQPEGASITLDGVHTKVARYLPDSVVSTAVVNDAPQPRVAVQVSLSASGQNNPVWVFDGDIQKAGQTAVALAQVVDRTELQSRLNATESKSSTSVGTVKLQIADNEYAFPMETCTGQDVQIGQTGYRLRVLDYFPHATVGPGGEIKNSSNKAMNPAVRVEINGPSGKQTRLAFARFPEFSSMHGEQGSEDLKLSFVSSGAAAASIAPIQVLTTGDGEMHALFVPTGESTSTTALRLGEAVDTPWPGMRFTVLQRFDHARIKQQLDLPEKISEARAPAVLLTLAHDGANTELWISKHQPGRVTVDGTQYEIAYADRTEALGFRVTLNKFTLGYYPGGRRPRSFESQITITDPATGLTLNRIISMNHPTSYGGFTFYQSSYQLSEAKATSVLSVSRDPGQPIVFAGFIGLMGGMLWVLGVRMRARSRSTEAIGGQSAYGGHTISLLTPGERCVQGGSPVKGDGRANNSGVVVQPPRAESSRTGRIKMMSYTMMALTSCLSASPLMGAELPSSLDLSTVRELCVQHDGRFPPLDTVARDVVESVAGKAYCRNRDPLLSLLAWTFDPETWMKEPLISIGNAELRREIGLPQEQSVFSYAELLGHQRLLTLIGDLSRIESGRKMDPLELKVSSINEQLMHLQGVFRGQTIDLIPDPADPLAAWKPIGLPTMGAATGPPALQEKWVAIRNAFRADDSRAFTTASKQLADALATLPAAFRPPPARLTTELRYNRLEPFGTAWRIMLLGTVLSALAMLIRRKWCDGLGLLVLLVGFGVLTYGLSLRWQIAGRIPASNMFESLLFLGWGVGAFAIVSVFLFRQRLVPLTAAAMASLALILADRLPVDHFIRPIAPVLLDTIWMSIHVPIIMVSYSVLALAVLIAHLQLVVLAAAPRRTELAQSVDGLLYWYLHVGSFLLTAGIITGSMWAASSWGRYWGWDPKEVWSLVALLGYLTILHVRLDHTRIPRWVYAAGVLLLAAALAVIVPKLAPLTPGRILGLAGTVVGMGIMVLTRGQFATAAKSIICFWLIVMTYVGVNFVLGIGLHSYGFGTGAVARYMFLLGGIDLSFVALCALVYLVRRSWTRSSHQPVVLQVGV
jgi:ABC-type transport system involved in cytochrome c biogenesis permease subunit